VHADDHLKLPSYWIEVHQIYSIVARSLRMYISTSEWRYCNPFPNARATRIVRFWHFWY